MYISLVKCDECGKEHDGKKELTVLKKSAGFRQPPVFEFEFCDAQCAAKYISKHPELNSL
jgi:hypothetical protein